MVFWVGSSKGVPLEVEGSKIKIFKKLDKKKILGKMLNKTRISVKNYIIMQNFAKIVCLNFLKWGRIGFWHGGP